MASSSTKVYPYPSSLNVGNFVSIKLTQNNFLLWKTQIMGLIESQDMFGFLDGELSMPDQLLKFPSIADGSEITTKPNPDYIAWRRSDRLLRGWITGTLSEEVLGLVVGLDTSADVWRALLDSFAQESQEREFYLLQRLQLHSKDTHSMTEPPIPSYRDLLPLLQSHVTMKTLHSSRNSSLPNHNMAFVGERSGSSNFNRGTNRRGRGPGSSRGRGFNHGRSPSDGYTQRGSQSAPYNRGSSFRPSQESAPARSPKDREEVRCQICDKPRHTALECWHRTLLSKEMEEKVEVQESHAPESSLEEEQDKCKETNQENAPVSVHKQNHQLENTKEVESGDRDGNMENHKTLAKNQNPVSEGEKVGETKAEKLVISSQKPKAGPKQNQKAKHTVPQPFSLATEKRKSRERRGESENRTLSLSKSASLNMNHRVRTQTSQRVELERSSELRNGTSTKSISQHGNRTEKRIEKEKIQKVVESKKSKGTAKEEEKDLEVKNVGKSTAFKALPLPSFYSKKAPPKQELKKIPLTRPKSPVFHQRSKSISDSTPQLSKSISELGNNQSDAFNRSSSVSISGNNKVDEVTKNSSKTLNKGAAISETRATKVEPIQKNAPRSRTISSSAKEALNKLLRGTWRTSNTKTQ